MAGNNESDPAYHLQDSGELGTSGFSLNMQYTRGANQPNIGLHFSTNSATSQIDPLITRTISQNRSQIQPTMRNAFAQEPLLAQGANIRRPFSSQVPTTPNLPQQSRYSYNSPQMYSQAPLNSMYTPSPNRLPQSSIVSGFNTGMLHSPYTPSSTPMQMYQRAPEQINMPPIGSPRQYQSTFLRTHSMQQYRQTPNPLMPTVNAQQPPRVPTYSQNAAIHQGYSTTAMAQHSGLFSQNIGARGYNQAEASRSSHASPLRMPHSSPAMAQHRQSFPQNIASGPHTHATAPHGDLPSTLRPLHPLTPSYQISTGLPSSLSCIPPPNNGKRAAPVPVDRIPKRVKIENVDAQSPAKSAHSTGERVCPHLPPLEERPLAQQPSGPKTSQAPVIETPQQPDQNEAPPSPTYPCNTSPKPPHPPQVRAPILWKHNTANIDDTLASIWNNAYDTEIEKKGKPEKAPDQGTRTLQEVETLLFEELRSAIATMDNANGPALPRSRVEQRKKGAKKDLSLEAEAKCPEGYVPAHEVMPSALGYVGPKKRD